MPDSLKRHIAELKNRLDRLSEAQAPPPTTLHILGRSQQEQDWKRLLFHFLSPEESHGLDHKLLGHFLTALSGRTDMNFGFSYFDIDNVRIETEVPTSNGGRVDAMMWVPGTWFICWELKVYASEGGDQTIHYVEAESFPTIEVHKGDAPMTRNYVYLAPEDSSPPQATDFDSVSWEWVAAELRAFLADDHGQYPARTTAQIEDFIGTIQSELNMTDFQESVREKAELYLDYYDEITEVQRSFETRWEELTNIWGTRLAGNLDAEGVVDIDTLPDNCVAVEVGFESGERDQWIFSQGSSDWAGISKYGWRRDKSDPSKVYGGAGEREEIHLTFFHRLDLNRKLAIEGHTLELQLWHGKDNPDQFVSAFKPKLRTKIEERDIQLPSSVNVTGSKGKPLTATYDIPVGEYDDFFEAYIAALTNAFHDLVMENRKLITVINESFEESLKTGEMNPN